MTTVFNKFVILVVAVIVSLVSVMMLSMPAQAQDDEDRNEDSSQSESQDNGNKSVYTYTAQPGDSYSKFARKAVQTYGKINTVNLSIGQIMYAETILTQEAGSPELQLNQEKNLEEAKVKEVVEKATKLDEATQQKWAVYAEGVNLNTDSVGQKR